MTIKRIVKFKLCDGGGGQKLVLDSQQLRSCLDKSDNNSLIMTYL